MSQAVPCTQVWLKDFTRTAPVAFATATMTLVGQNLGAGRPDRAARSGWVGFLAGGAVMAVTPGAQPVLGAAAATYGAATLIEAVRHGRRLGVHAIPVVWAMFPVTHVAHGLGFAAGLVRYLVAPDWEAPERLSPAPLPATPPAG